MSTNEKFSNLKKQKYYSKYRIVNWKILSSLRKKNFRNHKRKWRFLKFSLLNMKDFNGNCKKSLGVKSFIRKKEDFRTKSRSSCLKKSYRESLNEVRKIRAFFGLINIKNLKKKVIKYSNSRRSREKLFINYLESRLDVVIYRMRFSSSILESVNLIKRGFIQVNGLSVFNRNFQLNCGDRVKLLKKKDLNFILNISDIQNKIPSNFEINYKKLEGIFLRKPLKKELMYPENFCFNLALRRLEK